mgnify:FL=1
MKTIGSSFETKVESELTVSHCVLDCSILAAWVLADEASAEADKLLEQVVVQGAIAPSILSFEIMNVLIQAEKRGLITSAQVSAQLSLVGNLPLDIVSDPSSASFSAIVPVAQAHSLTSYDAAYLELAMREGLPLATTDKALRRAASKVGLAVLPS